MDLTFRPYQPEPQTWEAGIDLGSTFSAAATCLTSASNTYCTSMKVLPVTGYQQSKGSRTSPLARCEVPSKIRYEDAGARHRWGWDVVNFMERGMYRTVPGHMVELFKAGLDEREIYKDSRRQIEETLAALPFPKSVDEVTTDFLVKILQHIKSRLEALRYHPDDLIHLTITVPAMWTLRSRRRTIKAVEQAAQVAHLNFTKNIYLCSEPEAAAAYVFHKVDNIPWERGDTFIICDAGGVTVDVVTFVILSTSPLSLKEVVKGKGGFCGSSFLNERFKTHIEERIRDETYLQTITHNKPVKLLIGEAVSHFEHQIKREYDGDESDEVTLGLDEQGDLPYAWIPFPGIRRNDNKGFADGEIAITREDVELIFEKSLQESWELIHSQITGAYQRGREPTRMLIVGGYGASKRLENHLVNSCNSLTAQLQKRPIDVLVPHAPGTAIAAGSIYRYLNKNMVEDTISRSSICILQDRPFNGRLKAHKGAIHKLDNLEGRDYVPDCVKILLKAEQMIPSTGYTDTTHMHRTITADEEVLELTMPIYVYDDGNGADDYPLTHPSNMGFELLEEVTFEVPVAPIRNKLKRMVIGTSIASDQSSQVAPQSSQVARRSSRPKRGNPALGIPPPPPYTPVVSSGQPPTPTTLPPKDQCGISAEGTIVDPYYFWVDYYVNVQFKDGLMNYELHIKDVDRVFVGSVNLVSILEPLVSSDYD